MEESDAQTRLATSVSNIPRPKFSYTQPESLRDITNAANNAPAGAMAVPATAGDKKRKTLSERAGEPRKKENLSSKPFAGSAKTGQPRGLGVSKTGASRVPTNGSRLRPPPGTRNIPRPQTSMGHPNVEKGVISRPVTSLDGRDVGSSRNVQAWDQDEKEQRMSDSMIHVHQIVEEMAKQTAAMTETTELYKSRTQMLEENQTKLLNQNADLRVELEATKNSLSNAEAKLKDVSREQEITLNELATQHRNQSEKIRQDAKAEIEALRIQHRAELAETRRRFETELAVERQLRAQELEQMAAQSSLEKQRGQLDLSNKDREIQDLLIQKERLQGDLEREHALNKELQQSSIVNANNTVTLESSIRALKARIEFLESGSKEQSDAFAKLDKELREALDETNATKAQLRKEETLRRRLHNQIQELKGNIRVFCRVRPVLATDTGENIANISFPDEDMECREIVVRGPEERSSLGVVSAKNHSFSYDHVFGPRSQNAEVFEEISQLVQSALDGYNVCIFCYGQTGSGKTHTMSSEDGMIPRAVRQIYDTASGLKEKGWEYTMEGSFVEVYNENINDLLGRAEEFDKKKHEIRHDLQKCQTTVTNVTTVRLDSPEKVETILRRAWTNRSVAATKANERSSRSHSVFILRLVGENSTTGEHSEGTLNLVDLAGSERLSHSGSTGDRLKETQNINKSLSCLGDVIGALGQGKEGAHIPYRNSKLTYLLQFSLGGNSKTLMFVMVSPQQDHLNETLTSLKFAAKVQNTHVGTAKRQTRIRDS